MDSAAESCLNAMLGQLSQEPEEAPILILMPKLRDCAGDKQIAPHTELCIVPPQASSMVTAGSNSLVWLAQLNKSILTHLWSQNITEQLECASESSLLFSC